MTHPLPGIRTLLETSWRLFISTWNESVKVTIGFLYIGLIQFATILLGSYVPAFASLAFVIQVILVFATILVAILSIQTMLRLEKGETHAITSKDRDRAVRLILPLLWIVVLEVIIIAGGFLALIIPGLYLSIALSFSGLLLIDGDLHGLQALNASRALIKGRWWASCGRLLGGALILGLGVALVTSLILSLLAALAGPEHFLFLQGQTVNPLAEATMALFQSIIQASLLPLFLAYQVKLFRGLQRI